MTKYVMIVMMLLIVIFAPSSKAGLSDKLIFNFGGSISHSNISGQYAETMGSHTFYQPVSNHANIYGIHIEALYPVKRNMAIGGGFQYLFNNQNIDYYGYQTFQDDYDNRKPRDENLVRHTNVKVYLPYVSALYEFKISGVSMVGRIDLGLCYGIAHPYSSSNNTGTNGALGIGIVPSLGKAFTINKRLSVLVAGGYRFLKTDKMEDNNSARNYIYISRLDLSGMFLRSSFSFGRK